MPIDGTASDPGIGGKPAIDYRLYMVTDRDLMSSQTIERNVEEACRGGVTLLQLREKHADTGEFIRIARSVKAIADNYGVPLIINDNVEVATAVDAAGVHVGQDDMSPAEAKKLLGGGKVVGVSVSTVEEALEAQRNGADYLGIGAMSFTATKPDARVVDIRTVPQILDAVAIPCVVIGGINEKTIPRFAGMSLAGFSVVSAIVAAPDVEEAARNLRKIIDGQIA